MATSKLSSNVPLRRSAIVLLVVLGMLSLFSILVVTYVVFSSQARQSAHGNSVRRDRELDVQPVIDSIARQITRGGSSRSAAFEQDLLGDLYGSDHIRAHVAHEPTSTINAEFKAMLLERAVSTSPVSTLFKFPLHFASWNVEASSLGTTDAVPPLTSAEFSDITNYLTTLRTRNLPDYRLNDAFTGRLITLAEGPLAGNTFRVVRYFGTAPIVSNAVEDRLAGCVVIDLAESKAKTVVLNGVSGDLLTVAKNSPNDLVYDRFSATPLRGYPILINGIAFNGLGENASGVTQTTRGGFMIDQQFGPELLPNRRITGLVDQPKQPDEQYDAADFENWMLAWQPSDHRGILPSLVPQLVAQTGLTTEDASRAAPNIIPSFHRPEVINYLMHQPIWFDDNSDGIRDNDEFRRFEELTSGGTNDIVRLQILIRRIRAATFRPLNFGHEFVTDTPNTTYLANDPRRTLHSDLDGDGNRFDGSPQFSGSHPFDLLNSPIEINSSSDFTTIHDSVSRLATWLINGPWDVDNDGDGIPDSLWTDFDLPTIALGAGVTVKPLVAPLIEDLDGRINLNAAGNFAQLTSPRFQAVNPTGYDSSNPADYTSFSTVERSLQTFGRGGGIGPAEINFSHLFDEFRGSLGANAPFYYPQTAPASANVLATRFGNILQSRYGGAPWDYNQNFPATNIRTAHPGANIGLIPGSPLFSDPFSRVVLGSRRDLHDYATPMGRPMDMFGRSTTRTLRGGNAAFDMLTAVVPPAGNTAPGVVMSEVVNQPYEFEIDEPIDDDRPFTASEYHGLVDQGTGRNLAERLVNLLEGAAESNEALSRILTFDSRSLDGVELPGGFNVAQFIVDRLPPAVRAQPQVVNRQIQRMLAVELRSGSKLNLNRPLANGVNDGTVGGVDPSVIDETNETFQYVAANGQHNPRAEAAEPAFPQLDNDLATAGSAPLEPQSQVRASYLPTDTLVAGDEIEFLTASELLARNLYCLMYRLVLDPQVDTNAFTTSEFVPNFPYPPNLRSDAAIRNHYVARRLAQWAVNAVDIRDTDAIMTRLRFDPNPFDANGFDLPTASNNVVWGMERPELVLSETFSFHDRRVKREILTETDPGDPSLAPDGDLLSDIDSDINNGPNRDQELDQFRMPEASSIVELKSLRDPYFAPTVDAAQESFPAELYSLSGAGVPSLDLGRVVGEGAQRSPVWRLAVGYTAPGGNDAQGHERSTLWTQDATRFATLPPALPPAFDAFPGAANPGALQTWNEVTKPAGDILHPINTNAQLHLYDDDLDAGNGSGAASVTLSRFVWFTNLVPDAGLNVTGAGSATSGMRPDNVFYHRAPLTNPQIPAGGYAVVLPRQETVFGRTSQSVEADGFPYYPSGQKIEAVRNGAADEWSIRYQGIDGTRLSPNYPVDNANYRAQNIIPIIAEARPPHEVDTTAGAIATGWNTYFGQAGANERVKIGFNISSPLSGPSYYRAPTHRINETPGANSYYPLVDGYRSYTNGDGLHPDVPFDEVAGAPLRDNDWLGIGTYQDVASIFLQRLADPTRPWDATNNPYITVDTMAMDLTVFSGDEDLRQTIDHDSEPATPAIPIDSYTPTYPSLIAFDTRRKIPDAERERPWTQLQRLSLDDNAHPPGDFNSYERQVFAQRSFLWTRQSVLRNVPEVPAAGAFRPYFRHQLRSAWSNGNAASNATATLHSGFHFDPTPETPTAPAGQARRFDVPADEYPPTLGFINREFGEPAQRGTIAAGASTVGDTGRYIGFPIAVNLQMPTWYDRPYQSIYDLMVVPATSASRLHKEYDTGTAFEVAAGEFRETPTRFRHLLGFEAGFAQDVSTGLANVTPAPVVNSQTSSGFETLTGARAGFEQIFDLVDIGPLSFGRRRWFDPVQVKQLPTPANTREGMFNRVTQLLQPPFNYFERHRTPGKLNLNTMPDYIRQGGGYASAIPAAEQQSPFTAGTSAEFPTTNTALSGISSQPSNHQAGTAADPFNTAVLYGNGSVYQAISSSLSTFYELDNNHLDPQVTGDYFRYKAANDSRFGVGFKSFIHSRRGYGTTLSPSATSFLNFDLDYRYPTRFAGLFGPSAAATLPSVQRYMRIATSNANELAIRRTHDTSLLRTDRDFDLRVMTGTQRTNAQTATSTSYKLKVETGPTALPSLTYAPNASGAVDPTPTTPIANLAISLVNKGVFERSQAELHVNHRAMNRNPVYRFQNYSHLDGTTTHHSNVFCVRYTVGFFVVDPITGAVGEEYFDANRGHVRPRGFHLIDRSIPVGYEPASPTGAGRLLNADDAIIYSYTSE